MQCILNGRLLPQEEAAVGLTDLGLLRGYGIFDYFLFERFQARFVDDYLRRFYLSAGLLHLRVPIPMPEMYEQVQRLIDANGLPEGGIRLLMTGGYAADGYTPTTPNWAIMQGPFMRTPPEYYEQGVRLMLHAHQRDLPEVKSTNYFTGIRLQPMMRRMGAQYLLFHDTEGHISESDRSNFFLLTAEGELATADRGVLKGITRQRILEIARELGIPTRERPIHVEELEFAQEAFLTGTSKGVLPVVQVNQEVIGTGRPGPVAQRLHAAFVELTRR
ncbi:MAG: aminotransferase class IV [Lewinella sp.]|nr:aminotransferase class IV [Lewinella sp.]